MMNYWKKLKTCAPICGSYTTKLNRTFVKEKPNIQTNRPASLDVLTSKRDGIFWEQIGR